MTAGRLAPAPSSGREGTEASRDGAAPAALPPKGTDAARPLSVSRVAHRLAEIVDARVRGVRAVWIEGEVDDVRLGVRGTLRFTLGDGQSRIECVWWSPVPEVAQALTSGAQVIVRARPRVFTRVVGLVCVISEMRAAGDGSGSLAREQTRSRLSADGLFDPARKRLPPRVPRAVAVITSRSSAAWHDVFSIAERRHPGIPIVLVPAQMQGEGAPASIRAALRSVDACGLFDVVLITRGGGAASDLTAFDDESLARAIAACIAPVVTAIGHEVDFSIADAVADCREPTPSAAAARVIPERDVLARQLHDARSAMDRALHRQLECAARRLSLAGSTTGRASLVTIETARRRLDRAGSDVTRGLEYLIARSRGNASRVAEVMDRMLPLTLEAARPALLASQRALRHGIERLIAGERGRAALVARQLMHTMETHLTRQGARRERACAQFAALNPFAVLTRGYAIVRGADGSVIGSSRDLPLDGLLLVQFHDGVVTIRASAPDRMAPHTPGAGE